MIAGMPARRRLPHHHRLKTKREFKLVYERGRRLGGHHVTVWWLPHGSELRVGFVASRRVGGAVRRNRAKRVMREAIRLHLDELAGPGHMVISARPDCAVARRQTVEAEIVRHLRRAGCLVENASQPLGRPETPPAAPGRPPSRPTRARGEDG